MSRKSESQGPLTVALVKAIEKLQGLMASGRGQVVVPRIVLRERGWSSNFVVVQYPEEGDVDVLSTWSLKMQELSQPVGGYSVRLKPEILARRIMNLYWEELTNVRTN